MSHFWSGWIVLLTVGNVVFALAVLYSTARRRKGAPPDAETTGHVWDGDLHELNKPLPRWWLYLFYLSVAFAVVYLALYPGLGRYTGTLGWSQVSQYRAQVADGDKQSATAYAAFKGQAVADLATNPGALRIAKNLFAANCSMCHGSDARGAAGFPNLTSAHFQWGRTPEEIEQTIGGGRAGVMPPWQPVLGDSGVEEAANYVLSLSGHAPRPELVAAGQQKFATYCSACHGADAKGTPAVGAPDLTDANWLYGGTPDAVRTSIGGGRHNQMPAHLERLGADKVRLLAAYVFGLTGTPPLAGSPDAPAN